MFVELETNWEEGYKELTAKFLAESNDKLNGRLILSAKKQTDLKLVVKVEKVDNDGETYGKLYLYDKNNEVIAISSKIHGEGGRWGTQLNLMGDAIQRVGKQVGSFLLRYVK